MADEMTLKQRKKAVRRAQKGVVRSSRKLRKAEARRQDLKKKSKKVRQKIKDKDTSKKEREQLRERREKLQERRQTTKKKEKRISKNVDRKVAKRDKLRTYKTTKAGTPGVKNDTIDPFLTSEQIAERADKTNEYNDTISNLQYALQQQQIETDYNKAEIDKQKPYDIEKADNSAAGRGLFHSSVRDAQLFDIDATATVNKANYDRAFDSMRMDTERQALQATNAFNTYKEALNRAAVDNAAEASEGMELYKVDPTKAVTTQHQLDIPKIKRPPKPNQGGNRNNNPSRGQGAAVGPHPGPNHGAGPDRNPNAPGWQPTGGRPNPNRNR